MRNGTRTGCIVLAIIILGSLGAMEWKIGLVRSVIQIGADGIKERLHRKRFNSKDWKNPTLVNSKDPIRIRMVDDLLRRHRLIGMTKRKLVRLLGKPDKIYPSGKYVYYLGPERGWISIDSEILVVTIDKLGRVINVKISAT